MTFAASGDFDLAIKNASTVATPKFDTAHTTLFKLLELRRECARIGKQFAVRSLPTRLRDLATLYGIDGLLTAA